jgi:hypothetical protein
LNTLKTDASDQKPRDADTPACDAVSMCHLADVLDGNAPAELSCAEAIAFAQTAKYCLADPNLEALPAYFAPLIRKLSMPDVRLKRVCRAVAVWIH